MLEPHISSGLSHVDVAAVQFSELYASFSEDAAAVSGGLTALGIRL